MESNGREQRRTTLGRFTGSRRRMGRKWKKMRRRMQTVPPTITLKPHPA